jgi:hypothetical protein
VVAEAVDIEPVSASYFPGSREKYREFCRFRAVREFQRAFTGQNQKLTVKFPTCPSRDFKGKNRELNSPNRVALR